MKRMRRTNQKIHHDEPTNSSFQNHVNSNDTHTTHMHVLVRPRAHNGENKSIERHRRFDSIQFIMRMNACVCAVRCV